MKGNAPSPYAARVSAHEPRLWQQRAPLLGRLDFELTERCNNNCLHCCVNLPEADETARQRELSTDRIKAILSEAAALGALSVRFTGGEPLLREDFAELYLFARRLGLKVLIFTNARLVTPELAGLLKRVPPLEKVEITVYGMRRESYEAVSRVTGSYEEFWRGVNLLLEHGVPLVVKGALLPENAGDMEIFEDWAANLPAMEEPPSYARFFELRGRRDSPGKNRLIQGLRPESEKAPEFLKRQGERQRRELNEFCARFMGPPGEDLFVCGAGLTPCVDAYGRLQPCLALRHPGTVYDLRSGSLKEALTVFFPRLRETRAANPDYLSRCAICFLKGLCEQCPAKSWSEHGVLDKPVEYLCRVAHAQARELGLLKEGESGWEVQNWKERLAWLSP